MRVPIEIDEFGRGSTIDVSAVGVSFLIDRELQTGIQIRFELEFEKGKSLACDGRVVRVERRNAKLFTVATIDNIDIPPTTEH